jgi:hypothetical protein
MGPAARGEASLVAATLEMVKGGSGKAAAAEDSAVQDEVKCLPALRTRSVKDWLAGASRKRI